MPEGGLNRRSSTANADLLQDLIPIFALQDARSDQHHGVLGLLQALHELFVLKRFAQVSSPAAKVVVWVGQVHILPNHADIAAFKHSLSESAATDGAVMACTHGKEH